MSLTSRLQALLTYANNKTGASDTTLGDAINTLVDGYGSGGGSSDDSAKTAFFHAGIDISADGWKVGSFTLDSDVTTGYITIINPLGSVPSKFAIVRKSFFDVPNDTILLAGGYNEGNTMADSDTNRTITARFSKVSSTTFVAPPTFAKTGWNIVNTSCPSVATSEYIYVRTGTTVETKWISGEYYVAAI